MPNSPSRREQRYQHARRRRRLRVALGAGLVVAAAVAVLVGMVAFAGDDGPEPVVAEMILGDFTITGDLEVPAGPVEVEAVNVGQALHNVGIVGGPISRDLRPGEDGTVDFGVLEPGEYPLYCDVIGHVDLGMVATLTVTEAPEV